MNCVPGDIAFIVADDPRQPSPLAGRFVDVLSAAPVGDSLLPDGMLSRADPNSWLVKFHSPVLLRLRFGQRHAAYAYCPDAKLRPIRPQPDTAQDESLSWKKVPLLSPKREREEGVAT